jgi:hypothetical protein
MGTRHLVTVRNEGEYVVAQYGQWDGYPSGQGITILGFLNSEGNIEKLKEALKKVRFIDFKGRDKEFIEEYEKNAPEWSSDPDNRTFEQRRWFKSYCSRDVGGEILENIAVSTDSEILLKNSLDFGDDSLFCEYAYTIDLDKNTFEIYEDFKGNPIKEYRLDMLPTETVFLSDLEPEND